MQGWPPGRRIASAVAAGVLLVAIAACGAGPGGGTELANSWGVPRTTVTLGTTDPIGSVDPAAATDALSRTLIGNVYQTLLTLQPGTGDLTPEAADCGFHGKTTYECTLRPGQAFSNGDPVTAQDVVFSFKRVLAIDSPGGPARLLTPMKKINASGNTVTFTLDAPDATWPYVLTTAAGAIVDSKVFPADKVLSAAKVIGSGPYELSSYTANELAEFTPNPHYGGTDHLANSKVVVRYVPDASTLVSDLQAGGVDVAYGTLSPTELHAVSHADGVTLARGSGVETRFLVFNENVQPGANDAHKLAVRQAVAQLVDRSRIASSVYRGTVQPLYSVVPQGVGGATKAFETAYGDGPDVTKAKATLQAAGVVLPISMTIWYNADHFGDADLASELSRELDASGLFTVKTQTAGWASYRKAASSDGYGVYLFGWLPDYPDADDYLAPLFRCNGLLGDHYCNSQVTQLIAAEEASTGASQRQSDLSQIQTLLAQDLPVIPIWQGGQVAAVGPGITGVSSTLDESGTFRFWLVGKSTARAGDESP